MSAAYLNRSVRRAATLAVAHAVAGRASVTVRRTVGALPKSFVAVRDQPLGLAAFRPLGAAQVGSATRSHADGRGACRSARDIRLVPDTDLPEFSRVEEQ